MALFRHEIKIIELERIGYSSHNQSKSELERALDAGYHIMVITGAGRMKFTLVRRIWFWQDWLKALPQFPATGALRQP